MSCAEVSTTPEPTAKATPGRIRVPSADSLPPARKRVLQIDLGGQDFQYYEDGRQVLTGPVSSGTPEHPTPTGQFRVVSKEKDKVSHSYTNAFDMPTPMPYSLQFYGPYFVHEGWVPGYADSHGCVRLPYEDARFLFKRMRRGDEIVIVGPGSGSISGFASDVDSGSTADPEAGSWRGQDESGDDWLRQNLGEWLAPDDPRRSWR
jgi:lipoprotein-anchoring transpeptidase ErfK/SrfK